VNVLLTSSPVVPLARANRQQNDFTTTGDSVFCGENEIQPSLISSGSEGATPSTATIFPWCSGRISRVINRLPVKISGLITGEGHMVRLPSRGAGSNPAGKANFEADVTQTCADGYLPTLKANAPALGRRQVADRVATSRPGDKSRDIYKNRGSVVGAQGGLVKPQAPAASPSYFSVGARGEVPLLESPGQCCELIRESTRSRFPGLTGECWKRHPDRNRAAIVNCCGAWRKLVPALGERNPRLL